MKYYFRYSSIDKKIIYDLTFLNRSVYVLLLIFFFFCNITTIIDYRLNIRAPDEKNPRVTIVPRQQQQIIAQKQEQCYNIT